MPAAFLDFWSVFTLFGVGQGVLLAGVFFAARHDNRLANRLLGTLLLLLTILALDIFLCYTNYIAYAPFLVNLSEPLAFLLSPLHYWYTRAVTEKDFRLQPNSWWLTIPAIAYGMVRFPFLLQSNDFKLWDVAQVHNRQFTGAVEVQEIWWFPEYHFGGAFLDVSLFLWNVPLIAITFHRIHLYARQRHVRFFATQNATLDWLVWAAIYFSSVFGVFFITSLTTENDLGDIYVAAAMTIVCYAISLHLLTQSSLLFRTQAETTKKKYEKSTLRTDAVEASLRKLTQHLETRKPYLSSELTLPELAKQLSLSTHHLSQLINEQWQVNFFDLINRYRVEEAKLKLQDPAFAHLKIEEIAFQTGFNSKSAFNAAFKKITQATPSQFRREAIEQ